MGSPNSLNIFKRHALYRRSFVEREQALRKRSNTLIDESVVPIAANGPVKREDENMRCPCCAVEVNELWKPLMAAADREGNERAEPVAQLISMLGGNEPIRREVQLQWMVCPNKSCREILVFVHRRLGQFTTDGEMRPSTSIALQIHEDESYWASPRRPLARTVDALVPSELAQDFREACLILSDSPRMSAVLARSVLADVLRDYGHYSSDRLTVQVEGFLADTKHPVSLRKVAEPLRALGDLGAHSLRDGAGDRVGVDPLEAEWTLEIVERLFQYFIVEPEKDRRLIAAIESKVARVPGRRPLKKPS